MFAYVGTFDMHLPDGALTACRLDPATGRMEPFQRLGSMSPAYMTVSPSRRTLYVVNRGDGADRDAGVLVAFSIDPANGRLTELNRTPIPGPPAYVSLDRTERFALFASPFGAVAGAAPLLADGKVGEAQPLRLPGLSLLEQGFGASSIGKTKWPYGETAFPHCIRMSPDNRFALIADVGLNRVWIYRFDAERGQFTPNDPPSAEGAANTQAWSRENNPVWIDPVGAGPRHMEFHPNGRQLYVVHEAGSVLRVFDYDAQRGALQATQTIATLPADFSGSSSPADIHVHPNGRFLYATNRRHDSIVSYAIDQADGRLTLLGFTPACGQNPRTFVFTPDGALLLLNNVGSNAVVAFSIDPSTGSLTPNGTITEIPAPACSAIFAP